MVRNRYLNLFAGSLLALVGCGTSNPATDAAPGTDATPGTDSTPGTDAVTPPADAPQGPAQDLWYVVDTLTVDDAAMVDAMGSRGFNLDNLFTVGGGSAQSPGCGKPDYFSTIDRDQNCSAVNMTDMCTGTTGATVTYDNNMMAQVGGQGGVDNQLPSLSQTISTISSGTSIQGLLQTNIAQSKIVLLVRVSDVNSLQDDPSVRMRIYIGYPTFTTGCDSVAPGRSYRIASSSLMGTDIEMARFNFTGSIAAGRLRVSSTGSFDLPIPPIMGISIPLSLVTPQFRANLTDGPTRAATLGNLGGAVPAQAIIDAVRNNPSLAMYRSIVESAIGGIVDIQNPVCTTRTGGMLTAIGQIGLGLGLTMVAANVDTTMPALAAQPTGTCGAATPGG